MDSLTNRCCWNGDEKLRVPGQLPGIDRPFCKSLEEALHRTGQVHTEYHWQEEMVRTTSADSNKQGPDYDKIASTT